MTAGRKCSATVLALRLPCPGSAGFPALSLIPPIAPGAREPRCEAEHRGASTGTAAPAETDRPCLTGALTGKAFPPHADSLASTDIPLSQSEPSAAASLRAGLSHLSSPPRRLAPLRPPRLTLRRDAACGAAVPPWPCRPGYPGSFPLPGCAGAPGQSLCARRCPHGAILNGARGPPGMSVPVRVHVAAAAGGTAALDVACPQTRLILGHRHGAGCRLCRAAAEGCSSQREREAGLSAGFSGSAASNLWQLRACLPCQGSTVAPASQGSDRRCLEDRHRARPASGRKRAGKGPGTSAAPRPGCLGTAAPRGCSRGPGFAAPRKPHPSRPAALHRRNEREGGEIIQSRAEKCLNSILVGHGRNRISPVHWNIVSMFPQDG